MKTFKVAVQWIVTAEVEVEAETLDVAIRKVKDEGIDLPKGEYLNDSVEVNDDVTRVINGVES